MGEGSGGTHGGDTGVEAAPKTVKGSNIRDVNRLKARALQDRGYIEKSFDADSAPDDAIDAAVDTGHERYLAETGNPERLPPKAKWRPLEVPTKNGKPVGITLLDEYGLDPGQPSSRYGFMRKGLADYQLAKEQWLKPQIKSIFEGVGKLSDKTIQSIIHIIDQTGTKEDFANRDAAGPGAKLLHDRLEDLFAQAAQSSEIGMSGVIDKGGKTSGYLPHIGLDKGGFGSLLEDLNDNQMGSSPSKGNPLLRTREMQVLPRSATDHIGQEGLKHITSYYLDKLFDARNLPDLTKEFNSKVYGKESVYGNVGQPGSYADTHPNDARTLQTYFNRIVGQHQYDMDSQLRSTIHEIFTNGTAKRFGYSLEDAQNGTGFFKTTGPLKGLRGWTAEKLINLATSQKPSNQIISGGNSMAAVWGVGFNPSSFFHHLTADTWRFLSNTDPITAGKAFYEGVLRKSPALTEELIHQGVIDEGYDLENITGVKSAASKLSQVVTAHIRRTDNAFKAMVYLTAKNGILAEGGAMDVAMTAGRDAVYALQNKFDATNTTNAFASPPGRILGLFGRSIKAGFTYEIAALRNGEFKRAAQAIGVATAMYGGFRAATATPEAPDGYSFLPTLLSIPKYGVIPPAASLAWDAGKGALKYADTGDARGLLPPAAKRYSDAYTGRRSPIEALTGSKPSKGFTADLINAFGHH